MKPGDLRLREAQFKDLLCRDDALALRTDAVRQLNIVVLLRHVLPGAREQHLGASGLPLEGRTSGLDAPTSTGRFELFEVWR